jgi:lipoprotein-anchoring transpeptidase ErfK/SrfK
MDNDFVTTRLLWIRGVEQGKNLGGNVDSYSRRIYIHGTPEEGLIGKPSSHGCVRMTNHEVKELFELVEKGLHVMILNV